MPEEQCTQQQQCVTETQTVTDTTFRDECVDVVTHSCVETQTQVHVDTTHRLVGHVAGQALPAAHLVGQAIPVAAGPAALPLAAVNTGFQAGPAALPLAAVNTGFHAATPLTAHLNHAGIPLASAGAIVSDASTAIIASKNGIVKREADAEADAEADPQFLFGNSPFVGALQPRVPLGVAPINTAPVVAGVAAAPANCRAVTERQCRQVPVQVPRTIAVPRCTTVPVCVQVPQQRCNVVTRQVPETVCNPRAVTECNTVNRPVPETKCVPKPVEECVTINKQVPEVKCINKPVTDCVTVPRQVPVQVPVQKCADVPREECHPVVEQHPRQVCHQETVQVVEHVVAAPVHAVRAVHVAPAVPVAAGVKAVPHGGVYANQVHGVRSPTAYAYGDGKSFTRRDY